MGICRRGPGDKARRIGRSQSFLVKEVIYSVIRYTMRTIHSVGCLSDLFYGRRYCEHSYWDEAVENANCPCSSIEACDCWLGRRAWP
jgi:hypothetical protein